MKMDTSTSGTAMSVLYHQEAVAEDHGARSMWSMLAVCDATEEEQLAKALELLSILNARRTQH